MCCRASPVLASVIGRRCNLCNDAFHFYVDDMCHKGYLSKKWNGDGRAVYITAPKGFDVLKKFSELQMLVLPLEQSFGKLLV
jgi:predicted transcriptional regulator